MSLEQWRTLVTVVDAGGYAAAAEALNKSQSTVTYAVKRLESVLGIRAFEIEGRRAVLTPAGSLLYRRALGLIDDAARLETTAQSLSVGWEAQLGITVEVIFPTLLLLACLEKFGQRSPQTRIEVYESVMAGAQEDLLSGKAELGITPNVPTGFVGDPILRLRFIPVAHPNHALHRLGRKLTVRDLRRERQLLVRETGATRDTPASLEGEQRWTVSTMATSIGAACRGHGYAWFPEDKIRNELDEGSLKPLPMASGRERFLTIYLVLADAENPGPGVSCLADIIRQEAASFGDV